MEINEFTNSIRQNCYNPFSRLVAQHVQSMINQNCGVKEIEVADEVFQDIVNCTKATPTMGQVYKFIRIYDKFNSVDIQTVK